MRFGFIAIDEIVFDFGSCLSELIFLKWNSKINLEAYDKR